VNIQAEYYYRKISEVSVPQVTKNKYMLNTLALH